MSKLFTWAAVASLCFLTAPAHLQTNTRPISDAESVLAVYREDHGRGSRPGDGMIFAAWPDGHIVWSMDRVNGGAPYRSADIVPKRVTDLLAQLEKDGLFADEKLNRVRFGPDSSFLTILVKSGKKKVTMQSWHELFEEKGNIVCDDHGASALFGKSRLEALRNASAEFLFFRFVWAETRFKLTKLIPTESTPNHGKLVRQAGIVTWEEPASKSK